jgi:hypothetical protein
VQSCIENFKQNRSKNDFLFQHISHYGEYERQKLKSSSHFKKIILNIEGLIQIKMKIKSKSYTMKTKLLLTRLK